MRLNNKKFLLLYFDYLFSSCCLFWFFYFLEHKFSSRESVLCRREDLREWLSDPKKGQLYQRGRVAVRDGGGGNCQSCCYFLFGQKKRGKRNVFMQPTIFCQVKIVAELFSCQLENGLSWIFSICCVLRLFLEKPFPRALWQSICGQQLITTAEWLLSKRKPEEERVIQKIPRCLFRLM